MPWKLIRTNNEICWRKEWERRGLPNICQCGNCRKQRRAIDYYAKDLKYSPGECFPDKGEKA